MAENTSNTGRTPKQVQRDALGVDLEAATESKDARELPKSQGHTDVDSGPPTPTQQEVAAQTRKDQDARHDARPDRDDRLIHIGRSEHTKGRLSGNN